MTTVTKGYAAQKLSVRTGEFRTVTGAQTVHLLAGSSDVMRQVTRWKWPLAVASNSIQRVLQTKSVVRFRMPQIGIINIYPKIIMDL